MSYIVLLFLTRLHYTYIVLHYKEVDVLQNIVVNFRIDKELETKINQVCIIKRRKKSDLIRIAIEDYVNKSLNLD